MRILLLEDEIQTIEALKNQFSSFAKIEDTDDLLKFDEMLYESPGAANYDIILMDLRLESFFLPQEILREFLPNLVEKSLTLINGIPLIGWDYYVRMLLVQPATMLLKEKIYLLTGHAKLLERLGYARIVPDGHLLDKADEEIFKRLQRIIKQRKTQ